MASKTINISLPEEMLSEVDELAHYERRTRSELFREAMRKYIKEADAGSGYEDDRNAAALLSAEVFNRIWDNPVDAELWDNYEEEHARKNKSR